MVNREPESAAAHEVHDLDTVAAVHHRVGERRPPQDFEIVLHGDAADEPAIPAAPTSGGWIASPWVLGGSALMLLLCLVAATIALQENWSFNLRIATDDEKRHYHLYRTIMVGALDVLPDRMAAVLKDAADRTQDVDDSPNGGADDRDAGNQCFDEGERCPLVE